MANTLTFASVTLTDADIFGGISFTHDLNTGDEFTIGNTASASVKFVTDTQLPLYTKDQTNGVFTWTKDSVSRGTYYITEVTKTDGKYDITAYDAMSLLDVNISALSISFPATVSGLASVIAAYIGCTVSGTIVNGSLAVNSLDADMSVRQLLGYLAEASGCSVKIDGANHLCFMYYASSGITLTASDYVKLEVADYTCAAIDNVTIFNSQGEIQASYGSGGNSLFIGQNPFLETAMNSNAQNIYNVVHGLVYAPVKAELFDESGLEVGTIATFGTTATLIMHIESSESGATASSVGSDSRAKYNKDMTTVINETRAIAISAQTLANQAQTAASAAQTAAGQAQTAAAAAETAAGNAATQAGNALTAAQAAQTSADAAQASADEALASANAANSYASGAQYSLSEIERVVDAINWIAEHGTYTLTVDTEPLSGKWYFELVNGSYIQVAVNESDDPHALGYYELSSVDSSISNYVASHVSLDGNGLVIQTDNVNSKVRISASGVQLTNEQGVVVATFADSIVLGDANGMHVTLSPGDSSTTPVILPELGFWQGSTKVAYINSDTLFINQANIVNTLRIGNFMWKVQGTNRISLVYAP